MAESKSKKFTRQEVREHNNNKSCWVVLHNQVYDVTTWLDEHPGGCEVLLEQGGGDGTENFEDIGHSTDARELRAKYLLGDIVDSEKQDYDDYKKWGDSVPQTEEESLFKKMFVPMVCAAVVYGLYKLVIG